MGADQLVRVGVVGDDLACTRYGNRFDGVGRNPDSPGQLHGAVLVGVFEANIENRGGFATVKALFELFFGKTFDGHGAILAVPQVAVKGSLRGLLLLASAFPGQEWQRADLLGWLTVDRDGHHYLLFVVHGPPVRALPAMNAPQEDGARSAGDSEVMTPGQIAIQPVPHINLRLSNSGNIS